MSTGELRNQTDSIWNDFGRVGYPTRCKSSSRLPTWFSSSASTRCRSGEERSAQCKPSALLRGLWGDRHAPREHQENLTGRPACR